MSKRIINMTGFNFIWNGKIYKCEGMAKARAGDKNDTLLITNRPDDADAYVALPPQLEESPQDAPTDCLIVDIEKWVPASKAFIVELFTTDESGDVEIYTPEEEKATASVGSNGLKNVTYGIDTGLCDFSTTRSISQDFSKRSVGSEHALSAAFNDNGNAPTNLMDFFQMPMPQSESFELKIDFATKLMSDLETNPNRAFNKMADRFQELTEIYGLPYSRYIEIRDTFKSNISQERITKFTVNPKLVDEYFYRQAGITE